MIELNLKIHYPSISNCTGRGGGVELDSSLNRRIGQLSIYKVQEIYVSTLHGWDGSLARESVHHRRFDTYIHQEYCLMKG